MQIFFVPSTLVLLLIFPLLKKECLLNTKHILPKLVKPFKLAFDQLDEQEAGMLEEHLAGKQQHHHHHHLFLIAHKTMEFFSPFPLHTPISSCFYSASSTPTIYPSSPLPPLLSRLMQQQQWQPC